MPSDPEPSEVPSLRDRMLEVDPGPLDVDAQLRTVHGRAASRRRTAVLGQVAAAVAVVLLVAVGLAYVRAHGEVSVASDGGSSAPAPSPSGTAPGTVPSDRRVPVHVGAGAGPILAAGGQLWLAGPGEDGGLPNLQRITADGRNHTVLVSIDRRVVGLTADAGAVYLATWDEAAGTGALLRIDLATGREETLTPLNARAGGLAVAGGAVWHDGIRTGDGRRMLVRTRLGEVEAGTDRSTLVRPMQVEQLAAANDEVWVLEHQGPEAGDVLTVIDATATDPDRRVLSTTPLDAHADALAAGDDVIWLAQGDRLLRWVAGAHTAPGAPVVVDLPGDALGVVDASDPLTVRAYVAVSGPASTSRVVAVATDDVLRTTITDVPFGAASDTLAVRPSQLQVLGTTLWALDPRGGLLWRVEVPQPR